MKNAKMLIAVLLIAAIATTVQAATWHRATDWSGTGANPDGDWSYKTIDVETGSPDPYYTGTMADANWRSDISTYVNGPRPDVSWARIAKTQQDRMESSWNYHATYVPSWIIPAVQWTNNTGEAISQLDIDGTATLVWTNAAGTNGYNGATLEAMIFRLSADGTTYTPLQDLTSTKSANWNVESLAIDVDLSLANVQPGESIVVTIKGLDGQTDYRGQLVDDLTLTSIPEPATLTLLGLGAVAMLRRRHGH